MKHVRPGLAFTLVGIFGLVAGTARGGPGDDEFFERRVRPILATHCISCHGPKVHKGGLRLDSQDGFLRGGTSGPVVVAGDAETSLFIEAVEYDADPKMPPKGKLLPGEVEDLKQWVKSGAAWPEVEPAGASVGGPSRRSWAFGPVTRRVPPKVSRPDWCKTSVDPWVLAKLDLGGIAPSPPADRRSMIRRWTYTLTGLPPTPDEVRAYLEDKAPDADRRVVDRLLASPHYGERWARHWLDVARYADTKGYIFLEDKEYPWAYTYRDYVVRSLNEDLPYDQFIVEQLAADQLPRGDDRRSLAALGFLTVGARFMNNVQDILDDRIDVTTRGLMGLTVTCARCHDHKFDPIPTSDYYALYGVFASSVEPSVLPTLEEPRPSDAYRSFEAELRRREMAHEAFVKAKYDRLIEGSKRRAAEYLLAAQAARKRPKTDEFMLIADGHDLNPAMVGRWRALLDRTKRQHDPVFAPWHALAELPADDFATRARSILVEMGRRTDPAKRVNPTLLRALIDGNPDDFAAAAEIYERILNRAEMVWVDVNERARLNRSPRPSLGDDDLDALARVFHGREAPPDLARTAIDSLSLVPDRPSQEKLLGLKRAVDDWRATGPGAPPRAMVLVDLPEPIEPHVFVRGNPATPGPAVKRGFLSALSEPGASPFQKGSGRLELARAIADRKNPLTARVLVNRVWMLHFGTALVDTPGDFGARSDLPSHPELLDELAASFMDGGWSLKDLHRRIVLSAAFRQSSDDRPEARKVDPENRLLWRMNRRRLDWESTRDFMLATSGRLDLTVGGPPVKDFLASDSRRRTLYGEIDRLNLPGLYRSFDFPDPNATSPQRAETSVPPQALFFMNHPLTRDAARALLRRPEVQAERSADGRLDRCFAVLYGRTPEDRERALIREFFGRSDPDDAAWQSLIQALLLGNEFAFID